MRGRHGRRMRGARPRRVQSMAGPAPREARASGAGQGRARAWKAMAFRRTPPKEEAERRIREHGRPFSFGGVFLAYAVAARQGLVKIADGLRFGRRDAARVLLLLYATASAPGPGKAASWLDRNVARLLFPASGLTEERPGPDGGRLHGGIAEQVLEAAGAPGMHARFLKEFCALAREIFLEDGQIAFIDSLAMDDEATQGLPNPFMPAQPRSRWLFAVQRSTGFPLGLAEIRDPAFEPDGDGNGSLSGGLPFQAPGTRGGDGPALEEAFGTFAEAGLEAQSCLLAMRRLRDPFLDRFYGAGGALALPYVCAVHAGDPALREALQDLDMEAVQRPENTLELEEGLLFAATSPVRAGRGQHPAWLHVGFFYLPPGTDGEEEDQEQSVASPYPVENWKFMWRLAIATGREMTGPEAFKEYYALQKSAGICDTAPCRERAPENASEAVRRGHGLFCAMGLAAWGLLAHCMRLSPGLHLPRLMRTLEARMTCTLHPGRIRVASPPESQDFALAYDLAGIKCPPDIFLDGRRLRYDPLRDFRAKQEWIDPSGDLVAYLAELTPDRLDADLMDRPMWPRRHRPWRIGAGRKARAQALPRPAGKPGRRR